MSLDQKRAQAAKLKAMEEGFNPNCLSRAKLNEYNALYDPNMRHYFENRNVQKLLFSTGQIDKHGRVINLEKNKSKIAILEREFKEAEKIEGKRMQEEMEMRYRVQRKRFEELERIRKEEILQKLRDDKELSREILGTMRVSVTRSTYGHGASTNGSHHSASQSQSQSPGGDSVGSRF